MRNNRLPEPVVRVKQPALARFSPDVSPLFVHFRADDDVTARLYAPGYRLRPEFFKWRKIVLRPTPIMRAVARHPNAIHGHINDFLVRTGLRSGVSELQLPCFTAVRAEIALMSGGAFAVTHHPSVAEQEGQLIETEATGAPEKHHHTLNQ